MNMNNSFFKHQNLILKVQNKSVTADIIESIIPQSFRGKEEFVQFYLSRNGVYFPEGAKISTEHFQGTDDGHYELEIEFIYSIEHLAKMWKTAKENSDSMKIFAEKHIPFARDAAGNEFYIEIPSGVIKYVSWEYGLEEGVVDVAHCFKDFCIEIKSLN